VQMDRQEGAPRASGRAWRNERRKGGEDRGNAVTRTLHTTPRRVRRATDETCRITDTWRVTQICLPSARLWGFVVHIKALRALIPNTDFSAAISPVPAASSKFPYVCCLR
jgi:hypothetical protein